MIRGPSDLRELVSCELHTRLVVGLIALAACDVGTKKERTVDASVVAAARSPAEIRQGGNHLADQPSLYLREHGHNPIDWYPWGPEALARAKSLDRPIFLSIGYAACHWCHVMEAEVFVNDDVAAVLNESFVAIKVDREERPDIDALYMDALQSMTGSGGWPATLFLTPDRRPFFGATYLPRERFLEIAKNAAAEFKTARASIDERGKESYARLLAIEPPGHDRIRSTEVQAVAEKSLESIDEVSGGFKGRAKFPSAARWLFLLHAARKWGKPWQAPVRRTLDAMAMGGLFDHVGGGFFRYCIDATWTVPHFEKMLYVNASLARLYLEAHAAFGDARDLAVARRTLDFLLEEMELPDGGFAASLDADSDGKEGAFYVFTTAEIDTLFGVDAPSVVKLFGMTPAGNVDGKSALALRGDLPPVQKWDTIRSTLLAARKKRPRPRRDEKIVTAWNGLAIDAFARGFAATGEERYRRAAVKAADHLWMQRSAPNLKRTTTEDGVLEDYAAFASSLLTLGQATGEMRFLERASALTDVAVREFEHPNGGFYSTRSKGGAGAIDRRVELVDGEVSSGGAMMLAALVPIASLTGRFYDVIDKAITAESTAARRAGMAMASWFDVALLEAGPFYDVVIAGAPEAPSTQLLARAWRGVSPAWAVRTDVGTGGPSPELQALLPSTVGKVGRGASALAYVCIRGACREPLTDPGRFQIQLREGWAR